MFKKTSFMFLENHLFNYPTPINLTYLWNFGSLAGFFLGLQVLTGVFLSMHYTATASNAFDSIEHILRDVNYGWLVKFMHANGASFFFLIVYIHIGRALYFQSFITQIKTWLSGVVIFILMMATAFLGYVLPWGQMSLWGATVITNSFSAIPFFGKFIVPWLWGGYSVDSPTLARFYVLHYFLPFVIIGFVIIHILYLHENGSSNFFQKINCDFTRFFSYFVVKDLFGLSIVLVPFIFIVMFHPNYLGHPDNYIPANPLSTPVHIVPEWYFLPFYAVLRSIPNKLGGVMLMFSSIFILFFIHCNNHLVYTFTNKSAQSKTMICLKKFFLTTELYPSHKLWFWSFAFNFVLLGYLGSQPAVEPFIIISSVATFFYFFLLTFGYIIIKNIDNYLSTLFFIYYNDYNEIFNSSFWSILVNTTKCPSSPKNK